MLSLLAYLVLTEITDKQSQTPRDDTEGVEERPQVSACVC